MNVVYRNTYGSIVLHLDKHDAMHIQVAPMFYLVNGLSRVRFSFCSCFLVGGNYGGVTLTDLGGQLGRDCCKGSQ